VNPHSGPAAVATSHQVIGDLRFAYQCKATVARRMHGRMFSIATSATHVPDQGQIVHVDLWYSRLLCGVSFFHGRNASQQAAQQIGTGDDTPLRAPD
jgi:hypothetical protein